jgi:integrase
MLYPLFHVAALLGLRRGEVIGLRWSDIDFAAGTLTICRRPHNRARSRHPHPAPSTARWVGGDDRRGDCGWLGVRPE